MPVIGWKSGPRSLMAVFFLYASFGPTFLLLARAEFPGAPLPCKRVSVEQPCFYQLFRVPSFPCGLLLHMFSATVAWSFTCTGVVSDQVNIIASMFLYLVFMCIVAPAEMLACMPVTFVYQVLLSSRHTSGTSRFRTPFMHVG